ncbi:MAG: YraN family protein [Verrucomicrobiota bacterium]|nr:YraN family protein [Limisphaera sp.]MDW8382424.1 YraN family protein [Verrucomicrobiota bacterium]
MKALLQWWQRWWIARRQRRPEHLQRGALGERAARRYLEKAGLQFLVANYRTPRGELDLVFRDGPCLVFVEVKTRSSQSWTRPAAAVDARRQRRLSRAALWYLRRTGQPQVPIRFDIVEVLLNGDTVVEIRHLPNAFPLASPWRYG